MKVGAGYQGLLLGSVLFIFFDYASGSRCDSWQKRCPDGTCVNNILGRCPGECRPSEKKCADNSCVNKYTGRCSGQCSSREKKCPDNTCVDRGWLCPGECQPFEKMCFDGSCRIRCPNECFTFEKRCPDGTCVRIGREKCRGDCNYREKKCSDGTCVDSSRERCPGESCPGFRHMECSNSQKCYSSYEQCNGEKYCPDGDDEKGCSFIEKFWYLILILILVVLIFFLCSYKFWKSRSVRRERASQVQMQPTEIYTPTQAALINQYSDNANHVAPSAPPDPVASAPPAYDTVVSSNKYNTPQNSGLPSYDDVSDIPAGTTSIKV